MAFGLADVGEQDWLELGHFYFTVCTNSSA
jgi:hypothetical protein